MSVTAERLMVEVQADVRDALRKLDSLERRNTSVMSRMGKMARSMGLAFGGAAIVAGISKTIGLAMGFDKTIRQVGVQTDQTGKKLSRLGDLALKMGKDTVYSAQDAGSAMLELAKGGLTAAQIRTGALRQTLRLAAAGGLELANAAGYITQGMNTYGLKAKDAGKVTVALAGGANASTASVESLGMALSQVGAGSVNAGMSINETVAALAAFANKGIQGSDAGTSLKTMFANLVPATAAADAEMKRLGISFIKRNGDFKSMAQVAEVLHDKMGKLNQSERSLAMRTIFGSDATRAATVLMKEGEKGVRKYIAATKDRKKTQEMADAAMEGASGAWENFKGSVETAAIQLGTKMLPAFTKAANAGGDLVDDAMSWGPAIEESFGWVETLGKGLVGTLKPVVGLVKTIADAWQALPSPVKSTATQVLFVVLLFPRLAAAAASATATVSGSFATMSAKARQFGAEMTYAETRTQRLKQAAKAAAGMGGMMLLMDSAKRTGTTMGVMERAAGGAMLGFAVGGPWGAAIGGGVGALSGLASSTGQATQSLKAMHDAAAGGVGAQLKLRDALNQTTGAMTRQARQTVSQDLYNQGLTQSAKNLGISTSTLVSAVLGQEGAYKRVTRAVKTYQNVGGAAASATENALSDSALNIGAYLEGASGKFRSARNEIRAVAAGAKEWAKALKGVPKKVRTELEQDGYKESFTDLRKLVDTYKMTPKQITTMVKALGADLTKKQMVELQREGKKLGDLSAHPTVDANTRSFDEKIAAARDRLARLGGSRAFPSADLNDKASPAIAGVEGRLRALDGKSATVTTVMRTVTQTVKGIGNSFKDTFATGGYTGGRSTKDIVGAVHGKEYVMDAVTTRRALPLLKAIHAAKGRVFGYADGGLVGDTPGAPKLTDGQRKAQAAAAARRHDASEFAKGMVKGIREGLREMRETFKHLDRTIERNMSGKEQERWLKKSARAQNRLEGLYDRQTRQTKRLADAQEKLSNMRQTKTNFVNTVRDGMAGQATVLNAGNTAAAIGTSLGVQVAKVKRFAAMLRKLRKLKFSGAIIRQIAMAGIEGGYAAAEALVGATKEERAGINADFATITKTANSTAKALGAQMYDAGIRGAQGMVDQIKKRRKAIEDSILAIAVAMRDSIRKALGLGTKGQGGGNAAGRTIAPMSTYSSTKGLTVDSVQGGLRAGSAVSFNFVTHNPQAEAQSQTTNKALSKVATLGLV